MSFWKDHFLAAEREHIENRIWKFEYQVNDSWYEGKINSKKIVGNTITFLVSLPSVPRTAHTITGTRIWDITGKICAERAVAVKRVAGQGVVAKFDFPFYEKGDE